MKTTDLTFPEPCDVAWDTMSGDERRRFCGQCSKHVTHLSNMTQRQAKDFLLDNPGECVQVDVLGDDILFEPTPRRSMTFRKGWLRRAAAMGAVLAVSAPAFASGHVATTEPTLVERAVDYVKALVESSWSEGVVAEVEPVDTQPTEPKPTRIQEIRPLGGAPMPSPAYLKKIQAQRKAR